MKLKNITVMMLAAALMSSCGIFKNYERPADINTDGIYGDALSGGGASMGDLNWRDIFTDPQLQQLIETGLRENANMKQADLRIKEAGYAIKASKLAFLPSITFSPDGMLSKIVDYQKGYSKTYGLTLNVGYQQFNPGVVVNAKKQAEVNIKMMENTKQTIQANLVANIASLYYTLAQLDEQYELSKQTRENWRRNVEITKALMEAGQSNDAGLASTEANYHAISASVVDLEHSIKEVENILCALIGQVPGRITRSALDSFKVPSIVETGTEISILGRRPDVRQAEYNLATAYYTMNQARANFYPAISLTGNFEYTNSLGTAIVNPGKLIAAGVASLVQPIFRNGALKAQYKITQAEVEVAAIAFQQSLLDAGKEVNTAMAAIKASKEKEALYAKQVAAQERAVKATTSLYSGSSINYLQVLTAQTSLLSAQLSQITNKCNQIKDTIELYQALGGGAE